MMRRRSLGRSMACLLALVVAGGCGDGAEEPPPPAAAPPEPGLPAAPDGGAPAGPSAALPAGITTEMVEEGRQVYSGVGICFTCHGANAEGTPLGPSLTDGNWLWIEDPQEDLHGKLVHQIETGVAEPREAPAPMPPAGGAQLSGEQISAVAAYVVSLNPQ